MKILLAIDASNCSKNAVQFVGNVIGGGRGEHAVTLFHVIETLPDYILSRQSDESKGGAYKQVVEDLTVNRKLTGQTLLTEQKEKLVKAGVPEQSIHMKLEIRDALPEAKKVMAAIAIIEEMKSDDYSVICLGRHGSNLPERTFMGSVAEKVVREARGRSVWIIDTE